MPRKPDRRPHKNPRPLERGRLARATTIKLVVEYEGTRYAGWQAQLNARTVAGVLQHAIEEVAGGVLELGGSGRTDAGVHALAQVAHVRLAEPCDPARLLREVNALLPADVNLLSAENAHPRFHSRHDAQSRAYLYQIARRRTAFGKRFVWWVPVPLDVAAMSRVLATIVGRHDFIAFCQESPAQKSTLVVVERAALAEHGPLLVVRLEASHYLWRMVRRLTGAIVKVGTGELSEHEFATLLAGGEAPRRLGAVSEWTAPAAGLFLERVSYAGDPPLGPIVPAIGVRAWPPPAP